jgi:hypothetical protein
VTSETALVQRDVAPAQGEKESAWLRSLTEAQRAEILATLWRTGRELAEINIKQREPGIGAARLRWRVCELFYGSVVAQRLLGSIPP